MDVKKFLTGGCVVALVVVLTLSAIAMPVSARTVASGDTVFDYEEGLDLSSFVMNGDLFAQYQYDDVSYGQEYAFRVDNAADLDLVQIDLAGHYGTYYLHQNSAPTVEKIYIRDPSVSLDAVLDVDRSASIDGGTVSRNSRIAFVLDAPEVGTFLPTATVRIKLTTPDGATTTQIAGTSLTGIALDCPKVYVTGLDVGEMEDGTYTARAEWESPRGFNDYADNSNIVTFKVATVGTTIETDRERVIRGNPFVVRITGDAKTCYNLYIEDAGDAAYPFISPAQPGVIMTEGAFSGAADAAADTRANDERACAGDIYVSGTAATVATDATGTRVIEFATNASTSDTVYTLTVVNTGDATAADSVQVTVEKGKVTLAAKGTSHSVGDEIVFTGTNTDSDDVYLFLTGPNLGDGRGVSPNDVTGMASWGHYACRCVESDGTWEYRWASPCCGAVLSAGTYTLYAAGTCTDADGYWVDAGHLDGVIYDACSFELKDPTLVAGTSGEEVAQGDCFTITGTATGSPDCVLVWMLGNNYNLLGYTATVGEDGTFTFIVERADTAYLSPGNYSVIVQHPMKDGMFNVRPATQVEIEEAMATGRLHNPTYFVIRDAVGNLIDLGKLSASGNVAALVNALDSPNCDDIHADCVVTIEEPRISVDEIGERPVGDRFVITGTTNLAEGNVLYVDVAAANSSVASGTATVVGGEDGGNEWSFEIDTSAFAPGTYTVCVESVNIDVQQTATFTVSGSVPCTLRLRPGNSTVAVGGTETLSVVLDRAPQGLSGFEITVDLTETGAAEIVKVDLPAWAGLAKTGDLPADTLTIRAADLNDMVTPGACEVTLCTLSVRGDAAGSTGIAISPRTVESDAWSRYAPQTEDGLLEVIAIHAFPHPEGGFYPIPTDPDGDGRYEDLDGNGWTGFNDVVLYFNGMTFIEKSQPCGAFDYDTSGFIGFNDVVELFRSI
ncbi:DUF3821 domain-containing protein [Methanofollis formosanus]|uniref:DUF3821 domain-containing protein n=1 Tax=Methanofollis formosanus TaxID=299308 RepID=A0A8G1EFQ7_9EURY|nr:DUF3821 domain-containing protein [Methanofollis formosanus]QYZ78122.1 DUF3821 domain-containing protein [Methanofollis formosanus]